MRRSGRSAVEGEWEKVTASSPCAICGGQDRCRRGFDDEFACCLHVSSEWPLTTGGWVHRASSGAESSQPAGKLREAAELAP